MLRLLVISGVGGEVLHAAYICVKATVPARV